MVPKACCVLHGFITIEGEFLDKLCECKYDGFFEAVHSTADFEVDVLISFDIEVVFDYDFLWDHSTVLAYLLGIRHGCVEVEVLDAESKVEGTVFDVQDITVDVYFGL